MDLKTLQSVLAIGETVAVEFKRCSNGIEHDVYETVCSFLNRFGGDIFMGVLDDGTVLGVPEKAASDMVKNFIKVVSNPVVFSPTVYLVPEIIKYDETHTIIHVHIPPSAEVHSYKKVIYDRVDDADVKVTATGAIAQMYIRKQNIFTEKKIYPYAKMEDLRLDLLLEGDVFRIIVPLDEAYSFDFTQINGKNGINDTNRDTIDTNQKSLSDTISLETKLLLCIEQDAKCTQKEYAAALNVSVATVKRLFAKLQKDKILVRKGTNRKGQWIVIDKS